MNLNNNWNKIYRM